MSALMLLSVARDGGLNLRGFNIGLCLVLPNAPTLAGEFPILMTEALTTDRLPRLPAKACEAPFVFITGTLRS